MSLETDWSHAFPTSASVELLGTSYSTWTRVRASPVLFLKTPSAIILINSSTVTYASHLKEHYLFQYDSQPRHIRTLRQRFAMPIHRAHIGCCPIGYRCPIGNTNILSELINCYFVSPVQPIPTGNTIENERRNHLWLTNWTLRHYIAIHIFLYRTLRYIPLNGLKSRRLRGHQQKIIITNSINFVEMKTNIPPI